MNTSELTEENDTSIKLNGVSEEIKSENKELAKVITKEFIEETVGFKLPNALGWYLLLRLMVPDEYLRTKDGSKTSLILPDFYVERQKYQTCAALVVDIGQCAYSSPKHGKKPWVKIGDF